MKAIKSPKLFNGTYMEYNKLLVWDDDKIVAIGDESLIAHYNITEVYTTDFTVIPGFVDIQVNGAGGANFHKEGISNDTLNTMAHSLHGLGCTSFCPTLISSNDDDIINALDLINNLRDNSLGILGLHIEGPMFAKEFKGAHSEEIIRLISEDLLQKIIDSKVSIVTLAPETVPDDYILRLQDAGIKVAIGHTNATLEEIRHAESLGVHLGTHLYNAMSRFQSREPNTVGAILTSKSIYSSIIPDGNHSDFNAIKLAHKALGNRLFVVTDSILALGTELKEFIHSNQKVFVDEQKRCVNESGALVGSMISPIECITNLTEYCEYTLSEALEAYTFIPAKVLGVDHQVGRLASGTMANFSLLDTKDMSLQQVYFQGKELAQ